MENTNAEIWLPICGYDELYQVSNMGRVRSFPRKIVRKTGIIENKPGRILKPCKSAYGYFFVGLFGPNGKSQRLIHRLVASAFLDKSEMPHINHIDSNKKNNKHSNLEWTTPKLNTQHAIKSGRFVVAHIGGMSLAINNPKRAKKLSTFDVDKIKEACRNGVSQYLTASLFGISQGHISRIHRSVSWHNEANINKEALAAYQASHCDKYQPGEDHGQE